MRIIACQNISRDFDTICLSLKETIKSKDLVFLPEVFNTGIFVNQNDNFDNQSLLEKIKSYAKENDIAICGSVYLKEDNKIYNRFFFFEPNGKEYFYNKRHGFGDFEKEYMQCGQEKICFEYQDFKISPIVCYDLRFPVWCRNKGEYDILLCPSQWPLKRLTELQNFAFTRAMENLCYVLNVNAFGYSRFYNPWGDAILDMDEKTPFAIIEIKKEDLIIARQKRPYLMDKDDFEIKL